MRSGVARRRHLERDERDDRVLEERRVLELLVLLEGLHRRLRAHGRHKCAVSRRIRTRGQSTQGTSQCARPTPP
eukprot:4273695-Prymnesium_polylepis.1